ncbi:hypothetical protein [Streptomyces microflavus]|uniref:hypothetical protein n=1 Tax=Streptomyces microflavus TaxID=1919 RepID=UPI00382E221D
MDTELLGKLQSRSGGPPPRADLAAYDIRNPQAPDADMPRGSVDPRTDGVLFAHLADVRWAWARCDLPAEERRVEGARKLAARLNRAEYIDRYGEELEQSA